LTRIAALRAAVWLIALAALLILSPSEKTLGDVVKLVYLHGALVRTGLLAFTAAGALGLAALLAHSDRVARWGEAVGHTALVVWTAYVLSSMVVTYLAWGVAIAWGEPRVRASAHIFLAAVAFWVLAYLIQDRRATAALNAVLAVLAWVLVRSAGVVIHPVDPIGGSASVAIKVFYAGIVLCVMLLATELAMWFAGRRGDSSLRRGSE
jgi:hypothetical protein